MKKKLLALTMATVMAVGLVACGGGSSSSSSRERLLRLLRLLRLQTQQLHPAAKASAF